MRSGVAERSGLSRFLGYTPSGLARWLWLRATGREIVVSGECLMCGQCCRMLNLSYADRWIRVKKDFRKLLKEYPEYDRFSVAGITAAGLLIFECDRVGEDGRCADHENRPDICREYPLPELVFTGAGLNERCGYRLKSAPSFRKTLAKQRGRSDLPRFTEME